MEMSPETEERHVIMMKSSAWKMLNVMKRKQGKSTSEILEAALVRYANEEGFNPLAIKIMNDLEACSPQENEELTKILDQMTEDDLEVVEG